MEVGQLKHRLIIQTVSRVQNSVGQLIETWTDSVTVWTKKEDGSGTEGERNDIVSNAQKSEFTIRYRTINATDYRLSFNSQIYDIEGVEEVEFKKVLKLKSIKRSSF
tara:strand:- start:860 stop:1180 length:321 start_codon:yes stop_codon:yes gene_type:complete